MKKTSKVLSCLLALVFLFSAVAPVLATTGEDEGMILKGLGIIEGYEDGELKLEQTITRAEMCVVLSKIAGMASAAGILADVAPAFPDVKSGAWYTGYINLATDQGWVSGYPDGTFRPNDNVTNAEALAMLLNVLGYGDGELPGEWPLNYLVKAANLGLLNDLDVKANDDALRGWVFIYASEALEVELVNWSLDEEEFVGTGSNLLDELASGTTGEITIRDAYLMIGSRLSDDDRTVLYGDRLYVSDAFRLASSAFGISLPRMTLNVAEGFDIRPYVGVPTDFYLNEDGDIFAVKSSEEVFVAPLKEFNVGDRTLYLDDDDESEYDMAYSDGTIIINEEMGWYYDAGASASMLSIEGGTVRYALDSNDDVIFMDLVDYNPENYFVDGDGLVDEVEIDGDDVTVSFFNASDYTFNLDEDYIIIQGAATSFEELEPYDVLTWNREGSESDYAIYVTRDIEWGTADRYTSSSLRVDGVTYYFGYEVSASEDGGESFLDKDTSFDAADYSEEDVVLYLNGVGDIYAISAEIDPISNVAFVTSDVESDEAFGVTSFRVELFLPAGEHVTYYFDADLEPSTGDDVYRGSFAEYSLNDDGEIDSFLPYTGDGGGAVTSIDDADSVDYGRLSAGGTKYYATDDSVFILADPDEDGFYDDAELLSWSSIQSVGDVASVSGGVYADEDNDITYGVFFAPLSGDAGDYAVYLESWYIGSDDYVSFINEAGIQEAEYDDSDLSEKIENMLYKIIRSKDSVSFTDVYEDYSYGYLGEDAYDSTRNALTLGAVIPFGLSPSVSVYDVDADTVVIDLTGDVARVISLGDLEEEDLVEIYTITRDDYIDYIVVVDERSLVPR